MYKANINVSDIVRIVISDQFKITDRYLVSFLHKSVMNSNGLKEFYNAFKIRRKLKGSLLKYFLNRGVNISSLKFEFRDSLHSLIYFKYCESAFEKAAFIHFSDNQSFNLNLTGSINENNITYNSSNNLLNCIMSLNNSHTSSKEFNDNEKHLLTNLLANLYNEEECDCLIVNNNLNGILTEEFIIYNSPF